MTPLALRKTRNGNGAEKQSQHEHEEVEETLARHERELDELRRKVRTLQVELGAFVPNSLAEGG